MRVRTTLTLRLASTGLWETDCKNADIFLCCLGKPLNNLNSVR